MLEGEWVISTDLSVEDVHFRRGWLTDEEIGYRAASAALSDLAAMAARPVGVLVSMAAPRGAAVDVAAAQAGVRAAAEAVGARVIGGDLSRSPGPLFIDVVVLGRQRRPVSRAGARAGDELWVSGTLGAGAAALTVWEDGGVPPEPLRRRFVRPEPRVALALALAEAGIPVAMMDVSDGLAGDAGHLAAASGVRIIWRRPPYWSTPTDWPCSAPTPRSRRRSTGARTSSCSSPPARERWARRAPGRASRVCGSPGSGASSRLRARTGRPGVLTPADGSPPRPVRRAPRARPGRLRPLERHVIRLLAVLLVIAPLTVWWVGAHPWVAPTRRDPAASCDEYPRRWAWPVLPAQA